MIKNKKYIYVTAVVIVIGSFFLYLSKDKWQNNTYNRDNLISQSSKDNNIENKKELKEQKNTKKEKENNFNAYVKKTDFESREEKSELLRIKIIGDNNNFKKVLFYKNNKIVKEIKNDFYKDNCLESANIMKNHPICQDTEIVNNGKVVIIKKRKLYMENPQILETKVYDMSGQHIWSPKISTPFSRTGNGNYFIEMPSSYNPESEKKIVVVTKDGKKIELMGLLDDEMLSYYGNKDNQKILEFSNDGSVEMLLYMESVKDPLTYKNIKVERKVTFNKVRIDKDGKLVSGKVYNNTGKHIVYNGKYDYKKILFINNDNFIFKEIDEKTSEILTEISKLKKEGDNIILNKVRSYDGIYAHTMLVDNKYATKNIMLYNNNGQLILKRNFIDNHDEIIYPLFVISKDIIMASVDSSDIVIFDKNWDVIDTAKGSIVMNNGLAEMSKKDNKYYFKAIEGTRTDNGIKRKLKELVVNNKGVITERIIDNNYKSED